MDQSIKSCFEADKSTADEINSFNIDCDRTFQTTTTPFPVIPVMFKSPQLHGLNRGDFIHSMMSNKKKSGPYPACTHVAGKKRRENGRINTYSLPVPWKQRDYHPGSQGLHEEIEDFYSFMRPTEEEKCIRKYVIQSVEDVVLRLWPSAKVDVFGSFRTDLYLPTSDIDMVVFGKWDTLPMETLKGELICKGVAKADTVKVLDRAAVPIIKFQHSETKIKVDISFNMRSGVQSVDLVKDFLQEFPSLPKLMFVLKQFLLVQDFNEVWTGGLSSYSLLLMCVSFLQLHPRCDAKLPNNNLGNLLIEFFDLYGRCFNYEATCIRVKNGGSYITKEEFCKQLENGSAPSLLCIEDPLTKGNDLGRGTYAMVGIKDAFSLAHRILLSNLTKQEPYSFLQCLVCVPESVLEYRQRVCELWKVHNPSPTVNTMSTSDLHAGGKQECVPEDYCSSISSNESDFDERQILSTKPIHRTKSCDCLSQTQTASRKFRSVHNRYPPSRMHTTSKQCGPNVLCFTIDQNTHFRGAGEPASEQLLPNGKTNCETRHRSFLTAEENNRSEHRVYYSDKNRPTSNTSPSYRGRSTLSRMPPNSVTRKYNMQRPVPVCSNRVFER